KLRDTTYRLRELDGTVRRESVAANRIKIFYYRREHQTVRSMSAKLYSVYVAAASSSFAHATSFLSGMNGITVPPFPMKVLKGSAVPIENVDLDYRDPFSLGYDENGYPGLSMRNPSISDVTTTEYRMRFLNVAELVQWAREDVPLR
ncbi:hypothetical protein H0H81_010271, partial [Sphagnurus paluster]